MLKNTFPLLISLLAGSFAFAEDRPNFVLIIADDMAANDCEPFGNKTVKTPHLAKLASHGMRFDRAFVTTSSCSPSRCSMISGRWPHSHRAPHLHQPLPADQITFIELLRKAGYWTAIAGKTHLGKVAEDKFDVVNRGGGPSGCEQFVKTLQARPHDKPFFCWFAAFDPHRDYQANTIPAPHHPHDVAIPPILPDTKEVRGDLALYYDEIARMDGYIGEVLVELERQKVSDNTIVMFLSDNGFAFPRGKTTLYDSGIRTPLLVRWPKQVRANTECKRLVSAVDLAPTFLSLAGLPVPDVMQGKNIAPLFESPEHMLHEEIFAEKNWHDFDDHARAVRTERWKYIRYRYTDIPLTPPADAVRSASFQNMRALRDTGKLTPAQLRCFTTPRPAEELFDLDADPWELKNLAQDSEFETVLSDMRQRLDDWIKTTDDQIPTERTPDKYDRELGTPLVPRKASPQNKAAEKAS